MKNSILGFLALAAWASTGFAAAPAAPESPAKAEAAKKAGTVKQGNEAMKAGDWAGAVAAYESAPSQATPRSEAWRLNNWGYCLLKLEKAGEAAEVLERAVSSDSKNFTAWSNLGAAYETVGDKTKAIDTYKKALDLLRSENAAVESGKKPKDAEAAQNNAAAQASSPTADSFSEQPTRLRGEELKAALKAASDLMDQGKFVESSAAYEQIGMTTPAKREGWRLNNWGLALIRAGEYSKAVPRLKKSVEIFPDNPKAWNNLGVAYENLGMNDEAKAAYQSAAGAGASGSGSADYDAAKAELSQVKLDFTAEKKKWEASK